MKKKKKKWRERDERERIRYVKMNLDEGKREGGSGRGDVGREAQANVGLRFIYVFRKRVRGGLRSSKMVSWKNLQEAETKIYNKTKTQKRKQKQKENRKQKQKKEKHK